MKIKYIAFLLISCGVCFLAQAATFNFLNKSELVDTVAVVVSFQDGMAGRVMLAPHGNSLVEYGSQINWIVVFYKFGDYKVVYNFYFDGLQVGENDQGVVKINILNKGVCEIIKDDGSVVRVQGNLNANQSDGKWPLYSAS